MSWRDELKTPGIQRQSGGAKSSDSTPSLWTKCLDCGAILYHVEIVKNYFCCLKCQYHFPIRARKRFEFLLDEDSFIEKDADLTAGNPLDFKDQKAYPDRIKAAVQKSGENEAFLWGEGKIQGFRLGVGSFEFEFMGGSMGSVVGEKITRLFEFCLENELPALLVSSSGGARMQEGIFSLMQMAKTCSALFKLKEKGLPYISLLSHPTTGGVAASFAMLGDFQIAEPEALIGFAGPRVIEQTIRQKLPEGFQRAPFLLKHGMIDAIVPRKDQRAYLGQILYLLRSRSRENATLRLTQA